MASRKWYICKMCSYNHFAPEYGKKWKKKLCKTVVTELWFFIEEDLCKLSL